MAPVPWGNDKLCITSTENPGDKSQELFRTSKCDLGRTEQLAASEIPRGTEAQCGETESVSKREGADRQRHRVQMWRGESGGQMWTHDAELAMKKSQLKQ